MTVKSLYQSPDYVENTLIKSQSDSQALTTAKLSADSTETSLPPKPPTADVTNDAALSQLGFPQPTINSEQGTAALPTAQKSSDSDDLSTGVSTVGKDLYNGAVHQLVYHPGEVVLSAGMGVAAGAAASLAAPEVAIAAGVACLAYGVYKVAEDAPGWINDAKVASSPDDHTVAQEDQANKDLRSAGGGLLMVAAGGAGASVGGAVDSAIADANASRVGGVCMRIEDVYDRVMPSKLAAKPATDATAAQASTSSQASPAGIAQTGSSWQTADVSSGHTASASPGQPSPDDTDDQGEHSKAPSVNKNLSGVPSSDLAKTATSGEAPSPELIAPVSVQVSESDLAQTAGGGPGRTSGAAPPDELPSAAGRPSAAAASDAVPPAELASTAEKASAAQSAEAVGDKQTLQNASKQSDSGDSSSAGVRAPTPEERAATVNQLQNGKINDIHTIEDSGLGKQFTVGKISGADGKDMDVIIRPIDPASKMDLSRVNQAQIQANVDQITGIPTGSPESAVRQIELDGKLQTVAVQEYVGKTLGSNLKEWAGSAYGNANELGMVPEEDLQNIIQSHPALKESIGKGFLQVLYQGNPDMANLSNLAIRGSQAGGQSLDAPMQIPIIDSKLNWFPGDDATAGAANPTFPPPDWGGNAGYGDAKPVVDLYAGKQLSDISPALQQRAENLQSVFSSTQGRAQLLRAGLSANEIDAASARLQYLTTKGFPPLYKPFVDDEYETISGQFLKTAGNDYAPQRSASLTLQKVLDEQKAQLEPASA